MKKKKKLTSTLAANNGKKVHQKRLRASDIIVATPNTWGAAMDVQKRKICLGIRSVQSNHFVRTKKISIWKSWVVTKKKQKTNIRQIWRVGFARRTIVATPDTGGAAIKVPEKTTNCVPWATKYRNKVLHKPADGHQRKLYRGSQKVLGKKQFKNILSRNTLDASESMPREVPSWKSRKRRQTYLRIHVRREKQTSALCTNTGGVKKIKNKTVLSNHIETQINSNFAQNQIKHCGAHVSGR